MFYDDETTTTTTNFIASFNDTYAEQGIVFENKDVHSLIANQKLNTELFIVFFESVKLVGNFYFN